VLECRIFSREVAGSNLDRGYLAPRSTQPSVPPGSVNEYQLRLGRQRQVWLIPIADERVGERVKLKPVENACHTWALPRWWFTTKRRYIKCIHLYPYLSSPCLLRMFFFVCGRIHVAGNDIWNCKQSESASIHQGRIIHLRYNSALPVYRSDKISFKYSCSRIVIRFTAEI